MTRFVLLAVLVLGACSPQDLADKALRRTAETVVQPVVNLDMPAGPAQLATQCILDAASPADIQALARDIGVEAGTSTKARIRAIAMRPAAQACFAARNVPPIRG